MWSQLIFIHPSLKVKNSNEARAIAASKLPLPPIVFNRNPAGKLVGDVPVFVISTHLDGFAILGYGEAGVGELCKSFANLKVAFEAQYAGGEVKFTSGSLGITKASPKRWVCHHFVVQTASGARREIFNEFKADPNLNLTVIAEPLFRDALKARLATVEEGQADDIVYGDFVAVASRSPAWASEQPQFAVDLYFTANADFHGPFHIGRLANKGCGRIGRAAFGAPHNQVKAPASTAA